MDVALALTLTAAGAFLFMEGSFHFKFQIAREDGNRLYLRTAAVGSLLYVIALMFGYVAVQSRAVDEFDGLLVNWIAPLLKDHAGTREQSQAIIIAGLSLVLGTVLGRASNLIFKRDIALWAAVKDDDLEALLQTAALEVKPVAATLSNAKVYVGFVSNTFDPRRDRKMFTMLPLVSGYRSEDGKINFTTFYDEIYRKLPEAMEQGADPTEPTAREAATTGSLEGMTLNDFRVVIPVDKTIVIGFFDLQVYAHFNKSPPAPVAPNPAPVARPETEIIDP